MNKFILTLGLSVFSIIPMIAHSKLQTVKVFDGTLANCKTKYDVYRSRNGAYRAKALSAKALNNQLLEVTMSLHFMECKNEEGTYGFEFKNPYLPMEYKQRSIQNGIENLVRVTPLDIILRGYKDGVYKLFIDQSIPNQNSGKAIVKLTFPIQKILNKQQEDQLEGGQKIRGNFDLFLLKRLRWQVMGTDIDFKGKNSYGKFRVHLEMELQEGILNSSLVK